MDWIIGLVSAVVAGIVSGAVTWGVVKTELKYLRRDIDYNKHEIEKVEDRRHVGEGKLHDRISNLNTRMTHAGINGPQP